MEKIILQGACEIEHFKFLSGLGFRNFIIINDPSDDCFTSMKSIESILNYGLIDKLILSKNPAVIEEFEYYMSLGERYGVYPQFLSDIIDEYQKVSQVEDLRSLQWLILLPN